MKGVRTILLATAFCFALAGAGEDGARGFLAYSAGKLPDALRYYARALGKAGQSDNPELRARYNLNIAHILLTVNEPGKAAPYAANALQLYTDLNIIEGIALGCFENGRLAFLSGRADSAEQLLTRSKTLFAEMNNKRGAALAANELGILAMEQGNYQAALTLFTEYSSESKKQPSAAAAQSNNVGKVYLLQKEYDKAKQHFLKALAIDEQYGTLAGRAVTLTHLAAVFSAQGDCSRARLYFQRAQALGIPPFLQAEAAGIDTTCMPQDR